jgi:SAM-dependent methyltransferase
MKTLIIGSGVKGKDGMLDPSSIVTLDINPDVKPDVVHDLRILPLPFKGEEFDCIMANEVLEHTGQQGDWEFFFKQFSEFWRILKPNGTISGSAPRIDSPWLWGDPGHSRAITPECFFFLDQNNYKNVGRTAMTDYRHVWKHSFELTFNRFDDLTFYFTLTKRVIPCILK